MKRRGYSLTNGLVYLLLIIGAVVMLFPFIWEFSSSFKTLGEIFNYPPELIPPEFNLRNYRQLFSRTLFIRWFVNSNVVTAISVILSVFLCALGGFGFAKYNFRLRTPLFAIMISSIVVPFNVILIPLFVLISKFGWVDTYYALIIPFLTPAFGIFLIRQYMVSIPSELLDSARIDGCSEFNIFLRIILPLVKPILGAYAIFQFIFVWNAFLWPLVVLYSEDKYTLPLGLASFIGIRLKDYGMVMAASTLATIPFIIVFSVMQKQFISGLTLGAVKE